MEILSKCQKTMITQLEIYQITHIIKIVINLIAQIYLNKKAQVIFNELISYEN